MWRFFGFVCSSSLGLAAVFYYTGQAEDTRPVQSEKAEARVVQDADRARKVGEAPVNPSTIHVGAISSAAPSSSTRRS